MNREDLDRIPENPGVYMMKDSAGRVIYVGKANSLRKRVRSYFGRRHDSPRLQALVARIDAVETFLVDSETEALILESNLIKEHRPRYNVQLKDNKRYPYIQITTGDLYPRVFATRNREKDGSLYFGPYTDVKAMRRVLRLIHQIFPLRTCRHHFPSKTPVRLCLDYQIGKCLGPCEEKIGVDEYGRMVDRVILLLKGRTRALIAELRREMEKAAAERRYELAALLRDQVAAVARVTERQRITSSDGADRDVIALSEGRGDVVAVLLRIREGKMMGKEVFPLRIGAEEEPLGSFLKRIYGSGTFIPSEIVCDRDVADARAIEEWLTSEKGRVVHLRHPRRGEKKRLVDLARANANHEKEAALIRTMAKKDRTFPALRRLKHALDLPAIPRRIECFDISNLGDRGLVGASVAFLDGLPEKGRYRRYRIRSVRGVDDFASMGEIVGRRFGRLQKEGEDLPDLVIVDGGKGQLAYALAALKGAGAEEIPVIALAKKEEEIFRPGRKDPLRLSDGPALHLLQRIRDEAHRFAITYQRKGREKEMKRSRLDEVPGLGRRKKEALLRRFRSVEGVRRAADDDLRGVPGIGPRLAERIREALGGEEGRR